MTSNAVIFSETNFSFCESVTREGLYTLNGSDDDKNSVDLAIIDQERLSSSNLTLSWLHSVLKPSGIALVFSSEPDKIMRAASMWKNLPLDSLTQESLPSSPKEFIQIVFRNIR